MYDDINAFLSYTRISLYTDGITTWKLHAPGKARAGNGSVDGAPEIDLSRVACKRRDAAASHRVAFY